MKGLDPQQKAEVKKALSANRSLTNLEDAENILLQKIGTAKERYDKVMKNSKDAEKEVPPTEDVRRSDILDMFAAGKITKEEALDML